MERATMSGVNLYRLFDADNRLLYVGISLHAIQRATEHRRDKPWWPFVARMEFEHLGDITRSEAEARERVVIAAERPIYNVAFHPDPRRDRELRHAFECPSCGKPSTEELVTKAAAEPCLAVWRPCYSAIVIEQFAVFARLLEEGATSEWHAEHLSSKCRMPRSERSAVIRLEDAIRISEGKELEERYPLMPARALHPGEELPADPSSTFLLPWPDFVDLSAEDTG